MADQAGNPQVLQWGRLPDGRFQIVVAVLAQFGAAQPLVAPVHMFVLSREEEDKLLASLGGVAIARSLPMNGHKK